MPSVTAAQRAQHNLFQRHPLTERTISTGTVTFPYHIYDGQMILIGGTADLAAVRHMLADQQLVPLQTRTGRALMAVWVCDFTQANLGAHQELQLSIFVARSSQPPQPDNPLAILTLAALNPDCMMLCFRLWNTTATVVAYNRELFGLDASLATGRIQAQNDHTVFRFDEPTSAGLLLEGQVRTPLRQGLPDALAMAQGIGWGSMIKMARLPAVAVKVVNPLSSLMPAHKAAQTYTQADRQVISLFNARRDHLHFGDSVHQNVDFAPHFVSTSRGCRFVYLAPQPLAGL